MRTEVRTIEPATEIMRTEVRTIEPENRRLGSKRLDVRSHLATEIMRTEVRTIEPAD
jgi:hypothetical protein